MRWYRLAAEQGNATAQFYLGVMYTNGAGVPKDDGEAVRWYRLAAEQGYATRAVLPRVQVRQRRGRARGRRNRRTCLAASLPYQGQSSANEARNMSPRRTSRKHNLRGYWTRYVTLSNSPSDSQATVPAGLRGKPGVSSMLTHNRRNYGSRPPRGFRRCNIAAAQGQSSANEGKEHVAN